jgi:tyrosyl-tRNA synthetase
MSTADKFTLARSVGEECIQDEELRLLLEKKPHPIVYDGFEPSGRMHIAQGVLRSINVNKLTKCGCVFKVSASPCIIMSPPSHFVESTSTSTLHVALYLNNSLLVSWVACPQFWVADWFALLNNKMGGDLKKIQTVGKYMIEIWKAVGMDMRNVEFLWASEMINQHSDEYWSRVMDIARLNSLGR